MSKSERKGKFRVYRKENNLQFSSWPRIYWYFNLIATNGKVVATSQIYSSKRACLNGIDSVKRNSPGAVIKEE